MARDNEVMAGSRVWEKALFLLFLAAAFGSASYLYVEHTRQPIQTGMRRIDSVPQAETPKVGSEWTEVHLLSPPASLSKWEAAQSQLTQRVKRLSSRTLGLRLVYSVFPPSLLNLNSFEDFAIKPAEPLPGSVFQLGFEPRCIEFAWSEIPLSGVHYVFEIAKTRDFKFYRSFGAETNSVRIQVSMGSDYFWRVRGKREKKDQLGGTSSFLALDPPFTDEEKRVQAMAKRVKDADAWIADLHLCRAAEKP